MSVDTMLHRRRGVRTHEERVVAQVADVMWERETACILGVVFAELQERTPEGSDLAVELLHQYRHYYRIWTVLDGLRADVAAVLQIRRQGEDEVNKLDDYVRSSLHWYARYQQLVRRFVDDYGGMWLFSDADIEQSVIDAIKFVENFSRLTYRQDSQLRVLVTGREELDPFLRALEATPEGQEIIEAWQRHLDECDCDLEHPKSDCKVHLLMTACQYYIDAIDTEWYALAPWYRGMPKYRKIVDPATLYEAVGLKVCGRAWQSQASDDTARIGLGATIITSPRTSCRTRKHPISTAAAVRQLPDPSLRYPLREQGWQWEWEWGWV